MPYSNRSGTASEDGTSFAGRSAAQRAGSATIAARCGPDHLYALVTSKSAPSEARSVGPCGTECTPST